MYIIPFPSVKKTSSNLIKISKTGPTICPDAKSQIPNPQILIRGFLVLLSDWGHAVIIHQDVCGLFCTLARSAKNTFTGIGHFLNEFFFSRAVPFYISSGFLISFFREKHASDGLGVGAFCYFIYSFMYLSCLLRVRDGGVAVVVSSSRKRVRVHEVRDFLSDMVST